MLAGLDTKLVYSTLKRGYWGEPLLRDENGERNKIKAENGDLSRDAYKVNNPKYSCSEINYIYKR